jgi:hypothetical protein
MWFFRDKNRTNEEQKKRVLTQCRTRISALKACELANARDPAQACERLKNDSDLCLARNVNECSKRAKEFESACFVRRRTERKKNTNERANDEGEEMRKECERSLEKMRKCLRRTGYSSSSS